MYSEPLQTSMPWPLFETSIHILSVRAITLEHIGKPWGSLGFTFSVIIRYSKHNFGVYATNETKLIEHLTERSRSIKLSNLEHTGDIFVAIKLQKPPTYLSKTLSIEGFRN